MRSTNQSTNELQLLFKALGYIKTHWWLLALEAVLIYGYNLHKFHATVPTYSSSASILIDDSHRAMYNRYMVTNRSHARKENIVELLKSNEVMKRYQTAFLDYYNEEGRPDYLRGFFPGGRPLPSDYFRNYLNITSNRNNDIYSISCTASDPDAAKALCLVYLNIMEAYYPEVAQRDSMMKREFLSRQIARQSREISDRELALVGFQKKHPHFTEFAVGSGRESAVRQMRNKVSELEKSIDENRALRELLLHAPQAKRGEHIALEQSIKAFTEAVSELQFQISLTEQSTEPDREVRLQMLRKKLAIASERLAEMNQKQIELFLRSPIHTDELRTRVTKLEMEYRVALVNLDSAKEELYQSEEKAKELQDVGLEFDRLSAELEHRRGLLDELYKKEQEAEVEISVGQAELFRLQEPTRNDYRIAPRLPNALYKSLSILLMVALATILSLMALVPRLDSEAEVNRLNLPVIGKLPVIRRSGSSNFEDIPSFALGYLKIMNYRILRETKNTACPIVIISSPNAREGKSTVAQTLAIAAENPQRKTLLIDGDLLTINGQTFCGIQEDQTPGLKSVMENEDNPPKASDLIVESMVEGVSYMPRGGRVDHLSLVHHLKPIEKMIKDLRSQYDLIIVDTPPLFASNLAHQWAGIADLIVLVARLYVTRPKDIAEAIHTCKVFSKSPVGVALNCVPLSATDKRASNYYFSRRRPRSERMAA